MRIVFNMPAPAQAAFEAFHHHSIRMRWDTLLAEAYVEGGGDHPYVDAITFNRGKGWKAGMSMRTRFVSYEPPRLAAAVMIGPSGLFGEWAASMAPRVIGGHLQRQSSRLRMARTTPGARPGSPQGCT